jgi:hypothetical protein
MHMDMARLTLPALADILSRYLDRPVIDETGLKGEYHITLDLSMQEMVRIAKSAGFGGPGMGPCGRWRYGNRGCRVRSGRRRFRFQRRSAPRSEA